MSIQNEKPSSENERSSRAHEQHSSDINEDLSNGGDDGNLRMPSPVVHGAEFPNERSSMSISFYNLIIHYSLYSGSPDDQPSMSYSRNLVDGDDGGMRFIFISCISTTKPTVNADADHSSRSIRSERSDQFRSLKETHKHSKRQVKITEKAR
jgi:hypothetical protein